MSIPTRACFLSYISQQDSSERYAPRLLIPITCRCQRASVPLHRVPAPAHAADRPRRLRPRAVRPVLWHHRSTAVLSSAAHQTARGKLSARQSHNLTTSLAFDATALCAFEICSVATRVVAKFLSLRWLSKLLVNHRPICCSSLPSQAFNFIHAPAPRAIPATRPSAAAPSALARNSANA